MNTLKVPSEFLTKLRANQCAIFVGAGLSAEAGLPNWKKLLQELVERHFQDKPNNPEKSALLNLLEGGRLIDIAEYLRSSMSSRAFNDAIVGIIDSSSAEPTETHRIITTIPFSAVVTTNYDHLLEDVYSKERGSAYGRPYSYANVSALGRLLAEGRFFILKAHGEVEDSENIIFCRQDYHRVMFNSPAVRNFFTNLFASRTFLFIGCSLSDPDLTLILEELTAVFRGYGQLHYALMPDMTTLECNLFERRFNVRVIPYTPSDPTHPEVRTFLQEIANQIAVYKAGIEEEEEARGHAQKLELIGRLTGGLTHELNNWLTVILGLSETALRETPEKSPITEYITEIKKSAEQIAQLSDRLRTFSRPKSTNTEVVDINELATNVEKGFRGVIGEDIDFKTITPPTPLLIKADPTQIEQVLLNILINARDAMPNGGKLTVEVRAITIPLTRSKTAPQLAAGEYVVVAVTDTGGGISDGAKLHLFEPFFTTKPSGTGLGLATSFAIARQYGGDIRVYSEPDHGTTVKVYLPQETREKQNPRTIIMKPDVFPGGTETILVVEDELSLRSLMALLLGEVGYTVLQAENGIAALRLVNELPDKKIDLLITDVVMPKLGGVELAKRIRTFRQINVLFTSGYAKSAVYREKLSPADEFIEKPFTTQELLLHVRKILDWRMPLQPSKSDDVIQQTGTSLKPSVVIVDDEKAIRKFLETTMKSAGYEVLTASNGKEAIELALNRSPSAVILDIMMPDMDGFTVCKRIREQSMVPIIMLSAKGDNKDVSRALGLGADDYVVKPFSVDELIARVEAVLRRSREYTTRTVPSSIACGNLEVNFTERRVLLSGAEIKLTNMEYELLHELALNADRVLTFSHLLSKVWGPEYEDDKGCLYIVISRLRSKLGRKFIRTVSGVGYQFADF